MDDNRCVNQILISGAPATIDAIVAANIFNRDDNLRLPSEPTITYNRELAEAKYVLGSDYDPLTTATANAAARWTDATFLIHFDDMWGLHGDNYVLYRDGRAIATDELSGRDTAMLIHTGGTLTESAFTSEAQRAFDAHTGLFFADAPVGVLIVEDSAIDHPGLPDAGWACDHIDTADGIRVHTIWPTTD